MKITIQMKFISIFIFLTSFVNAEPIKSVEFDIEIEPPIKLESNILKHDQGKVASYQGYDKDKDIVYVIVVNQNLFLAKTLVGNEDLKKECVAKNYEPYEAGMKVVRGSSKTEMKSTLGQQALHFQFKCTGYDLKGKTTFHNGINFFYKNAFYNISVVSTHESTDRASALEKLIGTIKLAR